MRHFRQLWVQVLIAIVMAMVLGLFSPETAAAMKPLGDAFIALLRMMLAPIIFTTVVLGLAHVSDVGKLGRMGAKSLLYFEVVSTVGLGLPQDWGCKGQVSILRLFSDQGWMRGLVVEVGEDRG